MPVSLPAAAFHAVAAARITSTAVRAVIATIATGGVAITVTAGVTVTIAAAVTHLAGARAGVGPDSAAIAVARVIAASCGGIATAVVTAASGVAVAIAPASAVGIIAVGCVAIIVAAALAQGSTAVNRRGGRRCRRRFRIDAVIDAFACAAGVRVGPTGGQRAVRHLAAGCPRAYVRRGAIVLRVPQRGEGYGQSQCKYRSDSLHSRVLHSTRPRNPRFRSRC